MRSPKSKSNRDIIKFYENLKVKNLLKVYVDTQHINKLIPKCKNPLANPRKTVKLLPPFETYTFSHKPFCLTFSPKDFLNKGLTISGKYSESTSPTTKRHSMILNERTNNIRFTISSKNCDNFGPLTNGLAEGQQSLISNSCLGSRNDKEKRNSLVYRTVSQKEISNLDSRLKEMAFYATTREKRCKDLAWQFGIRAKSKNKATSVRIHGRKP